MPLNVLRLVQLVLPQEEISLCVLSQFAWMAMRYLEAWRGKHDGVGCGAWVR